MQLALNSASRYIEGNPHKRDDIISIAYLTLVQCLSDTSRMYDDNMGARINRLVRLKVLRFLIEDQVIRVPESAKRRIVVEPLTRENSGYAHEEISFEFKEFLSRIPETSLERQVMCLRIRGFTDQEIAEKLNCSCTRILQLRHKMHRKYLKEK